MTTRRDFLKTMSLASAGLALGSGELLNAQTISSKKGRNEKVKIAYIGIGNRGEQIIQDFARTGMVEVVALCDVDMGAKHTRKVMGMYPKAKQFRDFRQMFDKAGNEFDAVAIATPDHSHFPISMLALASGKHVYVEKPLARTFYEAELCRLPLNVRTWLLRWEIRDTRKQITSNLKLGWMQGSSRM